MKITIELKLEITKKNDAGQFKLMELYEIDGIGKDKIKFYYKIFPLLLGFLLEPTANRSTFHDCSTYDYYLFSYHF